MQWTKPSFAPVNLIHLRWHRDTRYYMVFLAKDLFGNWLITRIWGRQGSPLGGVKRDLCESFVDGYNDLKTIAARRKAHKYDSFSVATWPTASGPTCSKPQSKRPGTAISAISGPD
jgi:hypothetical protein